MSTISVHDIQGFSTYSNTVRIPNGHKLDIDGDLVIPTHTTGGRPLVSWVQLVLTQQLESWKFMLK